MKSKKITITILIFINLLLWLTGFYLIKINFPPTTSSKTTIANLSPTASQTTTEPITDLLKTSPAPIIKPSTQATVAKEIPIIMYHHVTPIKTGWTEVKKKMTIEPKEFERQLIALKKLNFTTYFVKDLPDLLVNSSTATQPIILTFDDGYKNFYTQVYPLLEKYQIKASLYIINNLINNPDYINTQELIELASSPLIEIGAHTLDHPRLSLLPPEKVRIEIERSKSELEKLLNQPILTFAYPYGDFNSSTIRMVKAAGFIAAVSTQYGAWQSIDNLFTLHRLRSGALMIPDSYLINLFNRAR